VLSVVDDGVHFGRVGERRVLAVDLHGVVLPRALPQRADEVDELVCPVVPLVVGGDLAEPEQFHERVLVIAVDDVPADPPLGQVIEGGESAGVHEGTLRGRRCGDNEVELVDRRGKTADDRDGIVRR
jgi:hypothetical protein